MSSEEPKLTVEQIREMFLNKGKTKFVFLKFVFSRSELLGEMPAVLLPQIYTRLNLEEGSFKENSFRHWHLRYKRNIAPKGEENRIKKDTEEFSVSVRSEENLVPPSKEKKLDDFKFTDPSTLKKKDDIIFRFVQPIKKNT